MRKNNIDVSIVIVHYNVKQELFDCINSIYKSNPKVIYEIVVVDNDEKKIIEDDLRKKFPKVKYIKNKNTGWGGGTNKGVSSSIGKFIYLLNPDTILKRGALDNLFEFANSQKEVGVVSSLLLDKNNNVYPLQGTKFLNPLRAIFSLSFINKLFPNNSVSKDFWMKGWNKSKIKKVDVTTLSAALIEKRTLEKVGGFDEKLFLYYEEYDLCNRLNRFGYKNYIIPTSRVVHLWEASTKKTGKVNEFIKKSRKYYFKKYYGSWVAAVTEYFLDFGKESAVIFLSVGAILMIGLFLRFDSLEKYSLFIGDQAWFYLSARDAILSEKLPLLGIVSSHTWLHQGPLWTYMLVPCLIIFNFSPIGGYYMSSFIGLITVILSYKFGSEFFSRRFGLIFALLISVSPILVFHSRFSYHTSPIPFFVLLLFYFFTKWIKGNAAYLPLALLTMSILYNFELATVIFWIPVIFFIFIGLVKKKKYIVGVMNIRIISISVLSLVIPMVPVLIYDFNNSFPQTVLFGGWFGYKLLQFIGIVNKSQVDTSSIVLSSLFFVEKANDIIFVLNKYASVLVLIFSFILTLVLGIKRTIYSPTVVVVFLSGIGFATYFLAGVPSEAYLVMLLPGLIFCIARSIDLIKSSKAAFVVVAFLCILNIYYLLSTRYLTDKYITLQQKIEGSKEILKLTNGAIPELAYKGDGSIYETSLMPYEYLVWWLGNKSSGTNEKILVEQVGKKVDIKLVD